MSIVPQPLGTAPISLHLCDTGKLRSHAAFLHCRTRKPVPSAEVEAVLCPCLVLQQSCFLAARKELLLPRLRSRKAALRGGGRDEAEEMAPGLRSDVSPQKHGLGVSNYSIPELNKSMSRPFPAARIGKNWQDWKGENGPVCGG